MAYQEFAGSLDGEQPKAFNEFNGELDEETGVLDKVKNASSAALEVISKGIASDSSGSVMDNAPKSGGGTMTAARSGIRFDGNGLSTVSSRAMDIGVDRAITPKGGETPDTMAETARFMQGSRSPRIADQEAVTRKPEAVMADAAEGTVRQYGKKFGESRTLADAYADTYTDLGKDLMSGLAGISSAVGQAEKIAGLEKLGQALVDDGESAQKYWSSLKSDYAKDAAERKFIGHGDFSSFGNAINTLAKGDWSIGDANATTVAGAAIQSAPGMVVMGGVGKLASAGLIKAGALDWATRLLARSGAPLPIAEKVVNYVADGVAFGGAEGVFSGLQNAAQTGTEIRGMSIDKLKQSPVFAQHLAAQDAKLPEEERMKRARSAVADDAEALILQRTIMTTGGISALTGGGVFGVLNRGNGTALGRAVTGIANEGLLQEFPQSGIEQYWQNMGKQLADPSQDLSEGVAEQAVQGGIVGAVMGVAGGGGVANSPPSDAQEVPHPNAKPGSLSSAANIAAKQGITPPSIPAGAIDAADFLGTPEAPAVDSTQPTLTRAAQVSGTSKPASPSMSILDGVNNGTTTEAGTPILDNAGSADRAGGSSTDAVGSGVQRGDTGTTAAGTQEGGAVLDGGTNAGAIARHVGKSSEVVLPDNTALPAQWEVVDADQVTATLKEGKNQPRDRSRAASNAQVQGIANAPDYRRLSDSPVMDVGAPTLSHDGAIVGGNGRFEGVSRAYDNGTAAEYLARLKDDAVAKGIDPAVIDTMKKPVLVRRVTQPFDTRALAVASNSGGSLQYSALEQAKIDGERMKGLGDVELTDNGDIVMSAANMANVRRALGGYTSAELGSLTDKDGLLSQEGIRRLKNAMLYKAYGNSPVLSRLVESADNDLRAVSSALVRAAGTVASVRSDMTDGNKDAAADIAKDLISAVELLSKIKSSGTGVDQYLSQHALFGKEYTEEAATILRFMAENIRSTKRMAEFIRSYYDKLAKEDHLTGGLFNAEPVSNKERLDHAAKQSRETEGTADAGGAAAPALVHAQDQHPSGNAQSTTESGGESQQDSGVTGTKAAPITVEHHDHVKLAEQNVNTNPTDSQKEAGNYAKGHIVWNGLDITIENPQGSIRSGKDANGKAWEVTMPATYGYIKRTEGADGDHIDVYLGKHLQSDTVYVIDQINPDTGKFDEHKNMLGFPTQREAERIYKAGFSDGKGAQRMGAVTPMSIAEFREWMKKEDTTKPLAFTPTATAPEHANADENRGVSVDEMKKAIAKAREVGVSDARIKEIGNDIKALAKEIGAAVMRMTPAKVNTDTVENVKPKAETLATLLSQYEDSGEIQSVDELADSIEAMEDIPTSVSEALDAYRQEQQDDRELSGRNDMDAAEDMFIAAIRGAESSSEQDGKAKAQADMDAALAEAGALLRASGLTMNVIPESDKPKWMPVLVKMFDAAFRLGYYEMKDAASHVREQLKKLNKQLAAFMPKAWMDEAAKEAAAKMPEGFFENQGLFGQAARHVDTVNTSTNRVEKTPENRHNPESKAEAEHVQDRMTNADKKSDSRNFKLPALHEFVPADVLQRAHDLIAKAPKVKPTAISAEDRAAAEAALKPLLAKAEKNKPEFDRMVVEIANEVGIGEMLAKVKGIGRAAEKLVADEGYSSHDLLGNIQFNLERLRDLLRATIVVKSPDDVQAAIKAVREKFTLDRDKDGERLKDNFKEPTQLGYRGILINVILKDGTVAEIQINIPEMLAAKDLGHGLYEHSRVLRTSDPLKAELDDAQKALYAAAFSVETALKNADSVISDQRDGHPGVEVMPFSGLRSSTKNRLPSGNSTYTNSTPSSSNKSIPNTQPSGNLSGIGTISNDFISGSSNHTIAKKASGVHNGDLLGGENTTQGAQHENQPTGAGGTQGESAATAGATQGKRKSGSVHLGQTGRNIVANRLPGDADSQASRDGQGRGDAADGDLQQRAAPRKGDRAGRATGIPAGRDIPAKTGRNYRLTDDDLNYQGSWLAKAAQNVEAVELIKRLETEKRDATREEQAVLAKFIGWGASEIRNNIFDARLDKQIELAGLYDKAIAEMEQKGRDYLQRGERWGGGDSQYYAAFQVLHAKDASLNYYSITKITKDQLQKAKPDMNARKWLALRDRLKAAMTEEEWTTAARSTQYAHYTGKEVVDELWRAVGNMGFKGGLVLEPGAGNGVFPGRIPVEMGANSSYTGIEFDGLTGAILKHLQPDERILVESYIDTQLPDNFYDVAIGNPPFSATRIVSDPRYKKQAFALHDYFFAKTMDKVKPGGLMVFVTSRYTMDKQGDKARNYLAERADLLGAIRLPETAFKKNAGTEVVTDILFLRKKVPGEVFEGYKWGGLEKVKVKGGEHLINEYFAAHPEMVLGDGAIDRNGMYAKDQYTVLPNKDVPIAELLAKAIDKLPKDAFRPETNTAAHDAKVREFDWNPKAKKEGSYYVDDKGNIMQVESRLGVPAKIPSKDYQLIVNFIRLRDAVNQAQYDQLNNGEWEKSLEALRKEYARFVEKHGRIMQNTVIERKQKVEDEDGQIIEETTETRRFGLLGKIDDDPEYTKLLALEKLNDETGEITDGDFLKGRVLDARKTATISTPADAMLSVLNDTGKVNMPEIAKRIGLTEAEVIESLGVAVYESPSHGWQMADEYLSGNVKQKLKEAEAASKTDRRYARNVEALLAVQPRDLTPADITASLGMNWIPSQVYEQFLMETAGVGADVIYNEALGTYQVKSKSGYSSNRAEVDWGTPARHAGEIMEHGLTGRPIRITKKVGSGSDAKTVFDADATEAANQKLKALREEFAGWLWRDEERTAKLLKLYNEKFNNIVPRSFDGRHLTLPGTTSTISVFDHVKRGAWRVIQTGNTYLAHAVGSGKTWQMVISAMEQKRLGMINKPMMVVPNHMLQQFAQEWLQLYPAGRLLVADEKQFAKENRRRFVARASMSDLDGIIITQSAFKLIDIDPKFKEKMIQEEIAQMEAARDNALDEDGDDDPKKSRNPLVRDIQKRIENLEEQLKAASSSVGKDQNIRFDEMGVDMLYVDEAHLYRKLSYSTARQVKGISPAGSQYARDLYIKTRWLEERHPGRSLVMASGTPITNTMAEMYSVQRFMQPKVLEERGLMDFDAWASMFGQEHTEIESDVSGSYAPVTRFSKFVNVPELTQMFREFADVLTSEHLAEMLGDKRPKVKYGTRKLVVTPQVDDYLEYKKELAERVRESKEWKPSKDEPNNPDPMIRIIGDGRLAAIDMRFIDPSLPSNPNSKLNVLADGVIESYRKYEHFEYNDKTGKQEDRRGATQMVFSDIGFGEGVAANRGFNARAWFEKRLRDAGIPMSHVAFMSDYKKSDAKRQLFKDVNSGKVRILVGSSKNMGTGVNAQQRLRALHHLDTPWFPADLEQREGRIIRQGNKNRHIRIFAYSTKDSYDRNMWQLLARKQQFIDQALSGDSSVRTLDDISEAGQYAMAMAMTAGDERIIRLAGMKADMEKYNRLHRAHEDSKQRIRQQYAMAGMVIESNERLLPDADKLAAKVKDLSGDNFVAKVGKAQYDKRKDFGAALLEKLKHYTDVGKEGSEQVGEISGFPITLSGRIERDNNGKVLRYDAELTLSVGEEKYVIARDPNDSDVGLAMRATNALAEIARKPDAMRQKITDAKSQRNALESRLDSPFQFEKELADTRAEIDKLEAELVAESASKAVSELESKAKAFAEKYHGEIDQRRKFTNEPYITHPAGVVEILKTVPHTEEMLAAAWAHDTVEDTKATIEDVRRELGDKVADLVIEVTDVRKHGNLSQEERAAAKREHSSKASTAGQTLKLADIIHNLSGIAQADEAFAKRYLAEKAAQIEVLTKGDAKLLEMARDLVNGNWSTETKFSQSSTPVNNPFTMSGLKVAINSAFKHVKDFAGLLEATGKVHFIGMDKIGKYLGEGARFSVSGKRSFSDFFRNAQENAPIDKYEYDRSLRQLADEIMHDWSNGRSDDVTRRFGPDKIYADLREENSAKYFDEDGELTDDGGQRYAQLEEQYAMDAAKSEITPPRKKVIASRPDHIAQQLNEYLKQRGLPMGQISGSGKSLSKYLTIHLSSGNTEVRISDHALPSEYEGKSEELALYDVSSDDIRGDGRVMSESLDEDEALQRASGFADYLVKKYDGNAAPADSQELGSKATDRAVMQERPAVRADESGSLKEPAQSGIAGDGKRNSAPDVRFSQDGRILAFVRDGQTYFVYDNISQTNDSVKGLAMHEIAVHALQLGSTDAEFQKILQNIETLRKMGNKKVLAARDRVPSDTHPELILEEQAGYLIEANPDLPIVQKLIARFRALLRMVGNKLPMMQRMEWFKWANTLTVDDIVLMAQDAMRTAPEALKTSGARGTFKAEKQSALAQAIAEWGKVVDSYLAGAMKRDTHPILLPATPASMQVIGLPDMPVRIKSLHSLDYIGTRLDAEAMKQIPSHVANPALVYFYKGEDGKYSLNFVTGLKNGNKYIVVALHPSAWTPEAGKAHYMATVMDMEAHKINAIVKGGGTLYVGDLKAVTGMGEAFTIAKRENGREAVNLRELASQTFSLLPTVGNSIKYKSAAVNMVDRGDALFSRAPSQENQQPRILRMAKKASMEADTSLIDKVASIPFKLVGWNRIIEPAVDRLLERAGEFMPEKVKAGLVSDYGLSGEYIDRKAEMKAAEAAQNRKSAGLVEMLAALTRAESRVAYQWMQEKPDTSTEQALLEKLPAESRETLARLKKMISDMGAEAVRLGQMSQEAYQRNNMAYLHRTYAKHVLDNQGVIGKMLRARALKIKGNQYKGRGIFDEVRMDAVGGEGIFGRKLQQGQADKSLVGDMLIRFEHRDDSTDAMDALPGMTKKPMGKLREVVYWPASQPVPAKYGDWVNAGTFEVRDTKGDKLVVWRDFTREERERMGELDEVRYAVAQTLQMMTHDIEVGRFFAWTAKTYGKAKPEGREVKASESMLHSFGKDEWAQVPATNIPGTQTKKYGALAGLYVPGAVWNDIRQTAGARIEPFGHAHEKALQFWKKAKTAWSPAVHMNNVMANFVIADWHDLHATDLAEALKVWAFNKQDGYREIYQRFEDSGALGGMFLSNEALRDEIAKQLESMKAELTGEQEAQGEAGRMAKVMHLVTMAGMVPVKGAKLYTGKMEDAYQFEDAIFRLAAFTKAIRYGKSDIEAGRIARHAFLNYDINAPWIQAARHTFLPFVSFFYRALPMAINTAKSKPWKIVKLMAFYQLVSMLGSMMAGGDDDEERKLLPKEKQGRVWGIVPKMVRMPWNHDDGAPYYLDIRRWVPVGDIADMEMGSGMLPPWATPSGVLILLAEVLLMNKSMFTEKEIVQDTDTQTEKLEKRLDHLFKGMMPNVPLPNPINVQLPAGEINPLKLDQGSLQPYAWSGVERSALKREGSIGEVRTTPAAIASAFGIKVSAYPAQNMMASKQIELRKKAAEIKDEIRKIQRNYGNLENPTKAEQSRFERDIDRQRGKLEELTAEQ